MKQRLSAGAPLGVAWLALGSPAIVEMAVAAGAEAIVIDMQHGLFDRLTLEAAIAAVPRGVPCLVRIEDDTPTAVGRALDAGAEGIIVPLVESGAEAARAAAACHYPPKGFRSGGGIRPLLDFAAYRQAVDEAITVGVMIETTAGLDNAEAIADADNVDFVFIGTGDLALSLGTTPQTRSRFERACGDIRKAVTAAGKPCGIFTMSAEQAAERARQGFAVTVVANDISVIAEGFAGAASHFAGAVPKRKTTRRSSAAGKPAARASRKRAAASSTSRRRGARKSRGGDADDGGA